MGSISGGFWGHFGVQKPFKFQSHFWDALLQLELSAAPLRRGLGAGPGAADPPRAAPFSRAEESYKLLYIARIANTRSDTQWARGPANFPFFSRFFKPIFCVCENIRGGLVDLGGPV